MQLVDEQQDASFGLFHFVQDGLQPLFKLAAVLGARHQRAHIQGENGLVLQGVGHVALDDPLGKPLRNGGLAYAGFADEDGVIFALPAQNADDVPDLVVPADNGVQLVLPCPLHQVAAVFLQGVVGLFRVIRGHPLVPAHGGQGLQNALLRHVVGAQQLLHAALRGLGEGQQQMLHGDIFVPHALCGLFRGVHGPVHALADVDLARFAPAAGHLGQLFHFGLHRRGKRRHGDAHAGQQLRHQAVLLLQQGKHHMGLFDLLVPVGLGQRLGRLDGLQRFLRKLIEIHIKTLLSPGRIDF